MYKNRVVDLHLERILHRLSPKSKISLDLAYTCLIVFVTATLQYVVNALTNCANKL